MVDFASLAKNSPFRATHNDLNYNFSNTTPDLLKFQLQEQYREQLKQLKDNHSDELSLLNTHVLDTSFNSHLQSKLDDSIINITHDSSLDRRENGKNVDPASPGNDSLPSLESDDGSDTELDSFVYKNSSGANYLNLRILIENSLFDLANINKDAILSLSSLRKLKLAIEDRRATYEYLNSKVSSSKQLLFDTDELELDSESQTKLLKSYVQLSNQLIDVSSELKELETRLTNHKLACLVLGYVEDVRLSSSKLSGNSAQESLDPLFSKIVSIAVKRNITLPEPDEKDRVKWAENCIERLLSHEELGEKNPENGKKSLDPVPTPSASASLQTALTDLQFSHQYLIKEYQHSRETSQKLINEYRKKITQLESQGHEQAPGSTYEIYDHDSISSKDKEIAKLRKELNLLKIDKLGSNSKSPALESPKFESYNTSNFNLDTPPTTESGDDGECGSISSALSIPRTTNGGMSNGILRKEFKKIVSDIQDAYEGELSEERLKRRLVQEELDRLRNK